MTRRAIALCIAALAAGTASFAQKPVARPTAKDAEELEVFFREIDLDRDGRLTKVEMSVFGQRRNIGVIVRKKGWDVLDANGNGTVTLPEFVNGMVLMRDEKIAAQSGK